MIRKVPGTVARILEPRFVSRNQARFGTPLSRNNRLRNLAFVQTCRREEGCSYPIWRNYHHVASSSIKSSFSGEFFFQTPFLSLDRSSSIESDIQRELDKLTRNVYRFPSPVECKSRTFASFILSNYNDTLDQILRNPIQFGGNGRDEKDEKGGRRGRWVSSANKRIFETFFD